MKRISVVVSAIIGVVTSGPARAGQAPADHHAASAGAQSCDKLASLALPHAKVTSAQTVAAGGFTLPNGGRGNAAFAQLPAFCRVAATLTPAADSQIQM